MQAAGYTADSPLEFELVSYWKPGSFQQQVIPGINAQLPEVSFRYRNVDQQTYIESLSNRDFQSAIGIQWGPPGVRHGPVGLPVVALAGRAELQ